MYVLTIPRPSSNIGYVGSKTRPPGQIYGNSCLHSRGYIDDSILVKLNQNVCIVMSRPSSNIGHVELTSRSPGQIVENICLHSQDHICDWILMSACVAVVKSRPVLHHCVVIFFWSSWIMACTCMLFTFENGVPLIFNLSRPTPPP